jgi:NADH-quinone oxidoreductase subunit F
MTKITSPEQLNQLRIHLREEAKQRADAGQTEIKICAGGGCIASGSLKVYEQLKASLESHDVGQRVSIKCTGCLGPCSSGPVLTINDTFYGSVTPDDVDELFTSHIIAGKPVERLFAPELNARNEAREKIDDIDFFKAQTKIVLRNCGEVDPGSIEDYIAREGFQGLAHAVADLTSDQAIEEVKESGLRGRGGAGFPTWMKWNFTRKAEGDIKYVLCNADEGDPGAFMDRSVLEGDPFSLIEGMSLAAYAIGAIEGYVYVRAEYPLAVERLETAIAIATERGLLGENILGSGFSFNLEIRMGSGAFVCGEETALINSIEGKRGEPRPRPPFPAIKGLWGKPSSLNNVETYANIPAILHHGGAWYAQKGTEQSKGTKVFALAGAIRNSGLVEVPVGTDLGSLVYDVGGGIPNDKPFKAAQIGGPSGGCIPKQHLNVPLDYDSLAELGAIMGSGGLVVMDEDTCMVDVARFFLEFVQEESCGKCVPCRVGTKRMLEILERICAGKGEIGDIDGLIELGEFIKDGSLCGLGQTAPNPVLSTIRHFRHEYVEHIRDKHCEAGICAELVRAPCQTACPAKVDVPGFVSLTGEKRYAEALKLHRDRNPFASVCARVCFHTCEDKCRRTAMDESVAVRGVKRFMVDQEVTVQLPEIRENETNAAKKIAIIGAGPAGMSCAYFLARLGYRPEVFEAEPRPGGMLVQTIPSYRLPREQLAREVRMIEHMGVDIKTNMRLGKDFTLESLREEGYEAVCIAIGAAKGTMLKLPGAEAEGVVDALDFLRTYNIRGSVPVGQNVVIIGGGNAAIDAARTAKRLDAGSVTVLYRRTQEEMPAYEEEIEQAIAEGVELITLAGPQEFVLEDGKLTGVLCKKMNLGDFDRSGRRRPVGSEEDFVLKSDQVIMAVGQELETDFYEKAKEMGIEKDWWVKADPVTGQTDIEWLFGAGDMVRGPSSVVWAIADGETCATGIDQYLTGEKHAFWRNPEPIVLDYDPEADPVPYQREELSLLETERRTSNFDEVERSWNEATAVRQAKRCLRCDYGKSVVCEDC